MKKLNLKNIKMIKNQKNYSLNSIIVIIFITILIFSSTIFCIEFLNLGSKFQVYISKNNNDIPLHKTNYYGKVLNFSPYSNSDTKYIHPYVPWSLPWKKDDIKNVNNEFINLNERGLRINPYLSPKKEFTGLLTGGSVAFGYYASSDKKTPAAMLTKDTNFNIHNLNGPSWNSYQELAAILNFNDRYDFVISYSASNDLSIFCAYTSKNELKENYPDATERFFELSNHVSTIQSSIYEMDFKSIIKFSLVNTIPETLKLFFTAKNYKKDIEKKKIKSINKNECIDDNKINKDNVKIVIDKFLENQKKIRKIAKINQAEHFLILQANFFDQNSNSNTTLVNNKLLDYYYNEILTSDFCKKNCYNFHNIFSNKKAISSYMNNQTGIYKNEIFIDTAHLSDLGNEFLAENILFILNKNFDKK